MDCQPESDEATVLELQALMLDLSHRFWMLEEVMIFLSWVKFFEQMYHSNYWFHLYQS